MSKQGLPLIDATTWVECCSPLVREPFSATQSVELARVFKAMGDPVRLRLLSLIASHEGGEACVCDLSAVFDLTGPTISHHLKVLREAGLITGERRGTWIYYRVQTQALQLASQVLAPGTASAVGHTSFLLPEVDGGSSHRADPELASGRPAGAP